MIVPKTQKLALFVVVQEKRQMISPFIEEIGIPKILQHVLLVSAKDGLKKKRIQRLNTNSVVLGMRAFKF